MAMKKGKQSKSSKTGRKNQGMKKEQPAYHDIGRGRTNKNEDNPYYMEDMEGER